MQTPISVHGSLFLMTGGFQFHNGHVSENSTRFSVGIRVSADK